MKKQQKTKNKKKIMKQKKLSESLKFKNSNIKTKFSKDLSNLTRNDNSVKERLQFIIREDRKNKF